MRLYLIVRSLGRYTVLQYTCTLLLIIPMLDINAGEISKTTLPVKGRAPVITTVSVINRTNPEAEFRIGHTLGASFGFADADGDSIDQSSFRWLRAGSAISGATASNYVTVSDDADKSLSVEVTPKSNPLSTDPAEGSPYISPSVTVVSRAVSIGKFLPPDTRRHTWASADSYCGALGGAYQPRVS